MFHLGLLHYPFLPYLPYLTCDFQNLGFIRSFSEAAKFTRKTVGIEITGTVLDEICKVVEIKS